MTITSTILFCLLVSIITTQQILTLKPLNRCLGNCAICQINSLDTCSGSEMIQCIKGYDGENCELSPTMAVQVALDEESLSPLIIEKWNQNKKQVCEYNHKNGSTAQHNVLGLFNGDLEATTIVQMNENYQNFIFSFNLVRTTWTPFSDLLVITLSDQNGKQLKQGFIEYIRRQDIDESVNLIQCNGEPMITQKYEINYVQGIQKIKELHIKFQSMVFSGSWGITNAKLAFGCNNFLIYSDHSCSQCLTGYYKKINQGKTIGCSICPTSCRSCTSEQKCNQCIQGFTLEDGECIAAEHLMVISKQIPSRFFTCNDVPLRMSSFQSSSSTYSVIGPIQFQLPPHKQIRIIVQIAHTIPKEDRQSHSEQFFLQLDNAIILDMKVLEKVQKPVGYCPGFANGGSLNGLSGVVNGFYAWTKISTPLLKYQGDNIIIKIRSSNEKYFGITQILFEINQRQEIIPPVQIPQQPIIEVSPETKDQVQIPNEQQNSINENNDIDTDTDTDTDKQKQNQLTSVVQQIRELVDTIIFDTKSDPDFHLSLKYPRQITKKPYLYVKIENQSTIYKPEKMRQLPDYQLFKFKFGDSFIEKKLQIFISDQQLAQVTQSKDNKRMLYSQNLQIVSQNSVQKQLKHLKSIDIRRFDIVSSEEIVSFQNYATFFAVIVWSIIIATLVLSLFGNSVIIADLVILLQSIFLLAYIDSTYLPKVFQLVLKGIQRIQNLDYLLYQSKQGLQSWFLGNVIQQSPLRFTIYNKDVNFSRAVIPILFINLVVLVWFIIITVVRKFLTKRLAIDDQQQLSLKDKFSLFFIRVSERILNFWYQIWQIQYLALVWAVFVQMHNLSYPIDSNRSSVPNNIFCFLILILIVILPVANLIYLNKKYFRLDYFQYTYWYKDIFFLQLPAESLPSNHHRIHLVVKNIRLLLTALIISFLGTYAIPAYVLLIILNLGYLVYIKVSHLQIHKINLILTIVEFCGFIALIILSLIAHGVSATIGTKQYNLIGHIMLVVSILLIVNGIIRVIYKSILKWKSKAIEKQLTEFKPAIGTERVV